MSGDGIRQPYRPAFYDEVNDSLTASTDIITKLGTVRICWHEETVMNIVIGPYDPEDRRTTLRRFLPPHPVGQELIAKFMRYFMGKPASFDIALPPKVGTDFQRKVWTALTEVPFGSFETYGDLAARLGLPASQARSVGNTVAQNPLPIVYPCHRVVAATGALTGFSAGPHWKKALLQHEGVVVDNNRVRIQEQQ
ncbi:MAG: methylated-DNA--[protein]-cysteine S-methyltransferase [Gemmatimonadetes bacterium]|jgi:methylated-DNA-[protein]-cysteine S-methyltransferase|nr:methylated-DNA--[protein]-cysteine S-methyltransferase [Gemmatimonadota bacterium]MBT4612721.1 methylated-DNA--[protein]-cysteine S-methyltransferase [Gemmatimonadota bacterium]MBT5055767.1 methylated-DNA--[protein]-cysteine S-methyltransferase [Gemmatimonadota bacterium]MBT5141750.1 methylated-DNA--[protein]-cysteine S-methyltransferase [Gemmatimonadota bacterium]MBT5591053.1 methylated-DNA--[protein]-cysteine S-methyltransferase [Gemmatimonadota bacterium]